MEDEKQLQPVQYLADRLQLSLGHTYRLCKRGHFGSPVVIRVGHCLRVNVHELDKWIENGGQVQERSNT